MSRMYLRHRGFENKHVYGKHAVLSKITGYNVTICYNISEGFKRNWGRATIWGPFVSPEVLGLLRGIPLPEQGS